MIADTNPDVIGMLLLVFVVLLIPVWWRIVILQRRTRQHEAELHLLKDDMRALCDGSISMAEYKLSTDQQLRRLTERQDQLDFREPVSPTYNHAIKLVQKGVTIDELMAACGLVRGEAELLVRLHRLN